MISNYGTGLGRNDEARQALLDYFIATLGHDLREYLSKMESFEDPEAFHRNLFCQWAVARGFYPLVFFEIICKSQQGCKKIQAKSGMC